MTTKVHGFADLGEFLTGNVDFFTITTLVPVDATGVTKPLSFLKKDMQIDDTDDISTKGGITIFGTAYADDNDYTDAFNKQSNFDFFIRLVEQRAQTIMLNVIDEGAVGNVSNAIPPGGHAADFGTNYAGGAGNIYTIKFATEHQSAWSEVTLAEGINAKPILDLTTGVIDPPDQFDTLDGTLRNTIVLRNEFI